MSITDVIAGYAALLSTAIFLREVWKAQPKLTVQAGIGVRDDDKGGVGTYLVISIRNFHDRPVLATHVGLVWPYRDITMREKLATLLKYRQKWSIIGWVHGQLPPLVEPDGLPKLIEPRHSHQVWVPYDALREKLQEDGTDICVASVQDALGRDFYSNPYQFSQRGTSRVD